MQSSVTVVNKNSKHVHLMMIVVITIQNGKWLQLTTEKWSKQQRNSNGKHLKFTIIGKFLLNVGLWYLDWPHKE